jgi:hypothetical protein
MRTNTTSVTGETKVRQGSLPPGPRWRRSREVTKAHKIQALIEVYADGAILRMQICRAKAQATRRTARARALDGRTPARRARIAIRGGRAARQSKPYVPAFFAGSHASHTSHTLRMPANVIHAHHLRRTKLSSRSPCSRRAPGGLLLLPDLLTVLFNLSSRPLRDAQAALLREGGTYGRAAAAAWRLPPGPSHSVRAQTRQTRRMRRKSGRKRQGVGPCGVKPTSSRTSTSRGSTSSTCGELGSHGGSIQSPSDESNRHAELFVVQ